MRTTHPLSEPTSTQAVARESTIVAIKHAVVCFFGMPVEELHYNNTTRAGTVPCQIAMYLVKQMTDASLPGIGRRFGGKYHSTVIHAVAKIEERRHRDAGLDFALSNLTTNIMGQVGRSGVSRAPNSLRRMNPHNRTISFDREASFQVSKRQARSCICSSRRQSLMCIATMASFTIVSFQPYRNYGLFD
jgi:hypothetical protein